MEITITARTLHAALNTITIRLHVYYTQSTYHPYPIRHEPPNTAACPTAHNIFSGP